MFKNVVELKTKFIVLSLGLFFVLIVLFKFSNPMVTEAMSEISSCKGMTSNGGHNQLSACKSENVNVVNSSFEEPVLSSDHAMYDDASVPGWESTSDSGEIELWNNQGYANFVGNGSFTDGNQGIELNAPTATTIYQDISTIPGEEIYYSFDHGGRSSLENVNFYIGAPTTVSKNDKTPTLGKDNDLVDSDTVGAGEWNTVSGSYTVPAGQSTTRIAFTSENSGGLGNIIDNVVFATSPLYDNNVVLLDTTSNLEEFDSEGNVSYESDVFTVTSKIEHLEGDYLKEGSVKFNFNLPMNVLGASVQTDGGSIIELTSDQISSNIKGSGTDSIEFLFSDFLGQNDFGISEVNLELQNASSFESSSSNFHKNNYVLEVNSELRYNSLLFGDSYYVIDKAMDSLGETINKEYNNDISLEMLANSSYADIGDTIDYSLVIENKTNSSQKDVTVKSVLSDEDLDNSQVYDSSNVTVLDSNGDIVNSGLSGDLENGFIIDEIPSLEKYTLNFSVPTASSFDSSDYIENTATVTVENISNLEYSSVKISKGANSSSSKSFSDYLDFNVVVDKTTVSSGDSFKYTMSLKNNSTTNLSNVRLSSDFSGEASCAIPVSTFSSVMEISEIKPGEVVSLDYNCEANPTFNNEDPIIVIAKIESINGINIPVSEGEGQRTVTVTKNVTAPGSNASFSKEVVDATGDGKASAGEMLTYKYTIDNTSSGVGKISGKSSTKLVANLVDPVDDTDLDKSTLANLQINGNSYVGNITTGIDFEVPANGKTVVSFDIAANNLFDSSQEIESKAVLKLSGAGAGGTDLYLKEEDVDITKDFQVVVDREVPLIAASDTQAWSSYSPANEEELLKMMNIKAVDIDGTNISEDIKIIDTGGFVYGDPTIGGPYNITLEVASRVSGRKNNLQRTLDIRADGSTLTSIQLVGNEPIYVKKGDDIGYNQITEMIDPQLTLYINYELVDVVDGEITLVNTDGFNNTKQKSYYFVYEGAYQDLDNGIDKMVTSSIFEVIVKKRIDESQAQVSIEGDDYVEISVNSPFDPIATPGISAVSNVDGDITDQVQFLSNDIDVSKPGYHVLSYFVMDSQGVTASKYSVLKVVDENGNYGEINYGEGNKDYGSELVETYYKNVADDTLSINDFNNMTSEGKNLNTISDIGNVIPYGDEELINTAKFSFVVLVVFNMVFLMLIFSIKAIIELL